MTISGEQTQKCEDDGTRGAIREARDVQLQGDALAAYSSHRRSHWRWLGKDGVGCLPGSSSDYIHLKVLTTNFD